MSNNSLKIISLGGFGQVTKNMFVYETFRDVLVVDCGVGFPEEEMRGVDLVIPDISYLVERIDKIRGLVLTHGHDDHIGGLPYLLPQLPRGLPIFGPRWAVALTKNKLKEFDLSANLREVEENSSFNLGEFSLEFIQATHSIPDTFHLVIKTPLGIIYHAADFKLDLKPVMGKPTNKEKILAAGKKGVLCLLSDCLRSENSGFTPPEADLEEMFEKEIADCEGKFLVTTISSNISRLKQAIDVSLRHQRKVAPVGRSIEENIKLAEKLKYLRFPQGTFIGRREIKKYPPQSLTILIAGSQAQVGSALDRVVAGEIEAVKIEPGDKVIFSTDYLPGNEAAIYRMIDNIYRLGGEVVYQDVHSNVHVSGHGFQEDLGKLMMMVKPRFFIPIGGNFRHMIAYQKLAERKGFKEEQVILPDNGQVVEFLPGAKVRISQKIEIREVMVDALGVGDVGSVVLRDRKILSEEGIVVIVIPIDQSNHRLEGEPEIISRGFIYMKENINLLNKTKEKIRQVIKNTKSREMDYRFVRRRLQEKLEKFFLQETGRRPMVLPVIIEV